MHTTENRSTDAEGSVSRGHKKVMNPAGTGLMLPWFVTLKLLNITLAQCFTTVSILLNNVNVCMMYAGFFIFF